MKKSKTSRALRSLIGCALIFAVLAFTAACQTAYVSPSEMDAVGEVDYTENEALILQKIAELGKYKASRNTACAEAEALRAELAALGAFPSEDALSKLRFDAPIKSKAGEISTVADFARAFDGVYEIFGLEKTYESDGKIYTVYEAIIGEDVGSVLTMKLVQGGRLGVDFFSEVKAESVRYGADNGKTADIDAVTAQGKTRSYTVIPFATTTVSLLFVKCDGGEWRHTMTSNFANIYENHFCVYSDSRDDHKTDGADYDSVKYPEAYGKRIAYAVEAYKLDRGLCRDMIVGCEIAPKIAELDEIADKRIEIEIAAPVDLAELVELAGK